MNVQTLVNGDNINPFSRLRDVAVFVCRHNPVIHVIAKLSERVKNNKKRSTIVVFDQIGYVFKENRFGAFGVNDSRYFKKQVASFVFKAALFPGYRKRLTRKARNENVKIRYSGGGDFGYISFY